jgi:hypothetical protein
MRLARRLANRFSVRRGGAEGWRNLCRQVGREAVAPVALTMSHLSADATGIQDKIPWAPLGDILEFR